MFQSIDRGFWQRQSCSDGKTNAADREFRSVTTFARLPLQETLHHSAVLYSLLTIGKLFAYLQSKFRGNTASGRMEDIFE